MHKFFTNLILHKKQIKSENMGNKIRITLTFDENIWYLLGLKVQGSRSQFLEDLAREFIFSSTDLKQLRDEISKAELELNAKKK